ncbi:MAG: TetR/AcrR family transcriptional regulator [Solirubrobacteraceae bacterium]
MSSESGAKPRTYEKRRRAEQERETRRRITEATVALHGSVGPARTTISAVAEAAGVQRATVYRHFPDEAALFAACSAHWAADHPRPDPSGWAAIEDPDERLRAALGAFYAFYRSGERMLSNVMRDAEAIPALRAIGERNAGAMAALVERLDSGRPSARAELRQAAIALALDFRTWHLLSRRGLDDEQVVALMARAVACADGAAVSPPGPAAAPRA